MADLRLFSARTNHVEPPGLKHSCSINLGFSGTDLISLLLGK